MLVAAFMANITDHVYFKDRNSRFLSLTPSLARSFGCSVEEVIGKTDFDFFEKEQAQAYRDAEVQIMATGVPIIDYLREHVWPDGQTTWSLNIAMPIRDDKGEIIGIFGTNKDVTQSKLTEKKLEKVHRELIEMSRRAGMAEAATGVLHNVGNVLNSVSVSANLIADELRQLKIDRLFRVATLLRQNENRLPEFMTERGRQVLEFLEALHDELTAGQARMLGETASLEQSVGHIKEIVAIQQSYATMGGLIEHLDVQEIVEDALKISHGAFLRHGVKITRRFQTAPKIVGERGKILQILNNLLLNAKHAVDECATINDKSIIVGIEPTPDAARVRITVKDNGVGIAPENLTRIFGQGFTTREHGHGFGLHSSANAAKEMRGSLHAFSDGVDQGALFVLELPATQAIPRSNNFVALGSS